MTDQPEILKTGAELRYEFRIAIIKKETYVSDALLELGGIGTEIIPGMAVPRGERILVKLKTKRCIERVYFSDECSEVKDLGNGIYESFGAGSGEKKMIVSYSDGGFSRLRFFVTDQPTDIIDDYASHVAVNQFETDPDDPCYHGILAWNMTDRCRVNSKNNP